MNVLAIAGILVMAITALAVVLGVAGIVVWWHQSKGSWAANPYSRFVMQFLISGSVLAAASFTSGIIGRWPGDILLILLSWVGLCVALSMPLFLWFKSKKEARNDEVVR